MAIVSAYTHWREVTGTRCSVFSRERIGGPARGRADSSATRFPHPDSRKKCPQRRHTNENRPIVTKSSKKRKEEAHKCLEDHRATDSSSMISRPHLNFEVEALGTACFTVRKQRRGNTRQKRKGKAARENGNGNDFCMGRQRQARTKGLVGKVGLLYATWSKEGR